MLRLTSAAVLLAALVACGSDPAPTAGGDHEGHDDMAAGHEEAPAAEPAKADPAAHEGHGAADDSAAFAPLPEGAGKVFFVEPADGATVKSPVHVVFGAEGVEVVAAGPLKAGTGHHHVIVDGEPVEAGQGVPKDDRHIHFGGGQTETDLELAPGEHTLTMQFADGVHRSYGAAWSAQITVTVEE